MITSILYDLSTVNDIYNIERRILRLTITRIQAPSWDYRKQRFRGNVWYLNSA